MNNWEEHIISDPNVLLGKPTIRGTRIAVEFILQLFAEGWDKKDIQGNYPRVSDEAIQAVFAYLAESMRDGLMGRTLIAQEI